MTEPTLYLLAIAAAWAVVCWLGWLVRRRAPATCFHGNEIQPGDIIETEIGGRMVQFTVLKVESATSLTVEFPDGRNYE